MAQTRKKYIPFHPKYFYVDKSKANYLSMGTKRGNFYFPPSVIEDLFKYFTCFDEPEK